MSDLQARLLRAIEEQHAAEDRLLAATTVQDRTAVGTFERWSLRDNVAHMAHWRSGLAGLVGRRRAGILDDVEKLDELEDAVNAEVHATWRDRPWEEVTTAAAAGFDAGLDELRAWDDAALDSEWSEGLTVAGRVLQNSLWHATHLATWLQERGAGPAARELIHGIGDRVISVDGSPRARGTATYNVACFDALAGDRTSALAGLATAFAQRPELAEWAPEDSDLASLQDDPDFLSLLAAR